MPPSNSERRDTALNNIRNNTPRLVDEVVQDHLELLADQAEVEATIQALVPDPEERRLRSHLVQHASGLDSEVQNNLALEQHHRQLLESALKPTKLSIAVRRLAEALHVPVSERMERLLGNRSVVELHRHRLAEAQTAIENHESSRQKAIQAREAAAEVLRSAGYDVSGPKQAEFRRLSQLNVLLTEGIGFTETEAQMSMHKSRFVGSLSPFVEQQIGPPSRYSVDIRNGPYLNAAFQLTVLEAYCGDKTPKLLVEAGDPVAARLVESTEKLTQKLTDATARQIFESQGLKFGDIRFGP